MTSQFSIHSLFRLLFIHWHFQEKLTRDQILTSKLENVNKIQIEARRIFCQREAGTHFNQIGQSRKKRKPSVKYFAWPTSLGRSCNRCDHSCSSGKNHEQESATKCKARGYQAHENENPPRP